MILSTQQRLSMQLILQLIVTKGTFMEDYFRDSNEPTRQKVWKERIKPYIDQDPAFLVR